MTRVDMSSLSEPGEPRAGRGAVPPWLLVVFGGLIVWAAYYVSRRAGGFDALVYSPYRSRQEVAALQPAAGSKEASWGGRRVFEKVCAICHGATGAGEPGRAPPLAGSARVRGDEDRLIRIVLQGLTGPMVSGERTWNLSMPALGGVLSAEELAAVLTHVRRSWGNQAPPVTVGRVNAVKAATAGRTRPWTAAELDSADGGGSVPGRAESAR